MKLNKKGFTLVELLAVIVVLALLMVVAAGSIGTALENSKKSALKTEAQKVLTSAAQDAVTANMLDSSKTTYNTGLKSEGDYQWYVEATVSGGVATVTDYCIIYSPSTDAATGVTTGKYSVGDNDVITPGFTGEKSFSNLKAPDEKICKIVAATSDGTTTYSVAKG